MLGFDYELRQQGYVGNSCQIILELDKTIPPDALRKRLELLTERHPILRSRPAGLITPKWTPIDPISPTKFPWLVRTHREQAGWREKIADGPLAIRQGELFRFDLVEQDNGQMNIVFTWTHALMDALSAEYFLAVVGREDVALPAVEPKLPAQPKQKFKDRVMLAKKNVDQLTEFCKAAPRSVGIRHRGAGTVQRYRIEKFSADETAKVRANATKLCGALGAAQYHAAAAVMELYRLHQRIGKPSPSYVLPVPVSLRPKGTVEPLFSNRIAMLMIQFLPEQLDTTANAVATLKTQLAQALRNRSLDAGVAITELSRPLPLPLYLYVLKHHGLKGEICSFFYGDTAAVNPLLTTFFGAIIRDFTHIGATTPSPGIGAIFYYFRGEMRVTVFYLERHFSSVEAAEFAANLRERLLNP